MFWRTQLLKDLGLSFIPAELGQLSALQSLYLPYNYLTFLPTDLPPNAIVIKKPHYFDDSSGMTKSQADFSQDLETFDRIIKVVKIRIMSNVCQYRIDRYTIWRSTYPANKAPYPIRRVQNSLKEDLEKLNEELNTIIDERTAFIKNIRTLRPDINVDAAIRASCPPAA